MESILRSHKLNTEDLLKAGWKTYWLNPDCILGGYIVLYSPLYVFIVLIPPTYIASLFGLEWSRLINFGYDQIIFFINLIWMAFLCIVVENAVQGSYINMKKAFNTAFPKVGKLILTSLLASIILMGLLLLLVVPGVIYLIYYTFFMYIVVLRNINGKNALNYSKKLVKGQWWHVFGISISVGILYLIPKLLIVFLLNLFPGGPLLTILTQLIYGLIDSYFSVVSIIFFLNNDYILNPKPIEGGSPEELINEELPPTPDLIIE